MPLKVQWFHQSEPVGDEGRIQLNAGDVYFFSDKAVGYDFKSRSQVTLPRVKQRVPSALLPFFDEDDVMM